MSLLAVLTGCSSPTPASEPPATTASSPAVAAPAPTTAPATPIPTTKTVNFVELQAGDCVADLPPSDLSSVSVTVVDCATPHLAQVFARRDIEVNAALNDVANQVCAAGFSEYAGRPNDGSYAITYLIDSNQDRTSNNPLPSTVICLAQAAGGATLHTPIAR